MIDELIHKIKHSETAVFCGAGISYHSGLPIVHQLISKILDVISVNSADAQIILNSDMPFETFIESIDNEVGVDTILEIFEAGEPNTTHELLAEFVMGDCGYVRFFLLEDN